MQRNGNGRRLFAFGRIDGMRARIGQCIDCEGSGVLYLRNLRERETVDCQADLYDEVECSACAGTGREICEACDQRRSAPHSPYCVSCEEEWRP
jgi:hypothetical protein